MFLSHFLDKDTITVHCIVERIADALSALVLRQSTAENSQNSDETMELDNSLNKTASGKTSTLLSDLLQSYHTKSDKESTKDDLSRDEYKGDFKCDFKSDSKGDFKTEFNKDKIEDELNKPNDNRDDRPAYERSPKQQSNQMETDQFGSESAMKEQFLSTSKNPLSIVAEMLRSKGQTNNYKIEDDFYAELPANTPLQELVRCALTKQGYSVDDCSSAKGLCSQRLLYLFCCY